MISKNYLKQIAESKGVCPLTNVVKNNALLFPIGFEYIFKDLDRLEKLEKNFSDSHTCEIKARFNEIECSADKCDNCPLCLGDGICLKNTFEKKWELQKENQALKEENAKLKKAIDFLKLSFDISLDSKLRISDGSECVQTFIIYLPKNTTIDEMFEILKEVLDKNENS